MKRIYIISALITVLFLSAFKGFSQETEAEAEGECPASIDLGADLVSRYVWRGIQYGNASLQPTMGLSVGNFSFGTFGSASLMSNTDVMILQEADFYAQYTFADMFTVLVYDYFYGADFAENRYFEYAKDSTAHVIEATLSFDGTEKIPFSFLVAANVYGADARNLDNSLVYSTYAELAYNTELKNTGISAFIGAALNAPDDETLPSYYANSKPALINLGVTVTKEIPITDKFSLPIFGSFVTNPYASNAWMLFGISISN